MNSHKLYKNITIVALFSFLVFEYFSMSNLAGMGDSSLRSLSKLVVEIIAIFLLASNRGDSNTRFWTLWMSWNILITILVLSTDSSISTIVYNWFPQAAFLVGYYCNKRFPDLKKYLRVSVIPLLIVAIYFILKNPFNFMLQDGEKGVDNMIFYIVCLVPFIMLIKKDSYKGILLVVCVLMAVNSLKRNAMIMMALFLLIFIFSVLRQHRGMHFRNMVVVATIFVVGYYYLIDYMSLSIEQSLLRFEAMSDDGGSGRDVIWKHCIEAIGRNDVVSWMFGYGPNSTFKVVQHTSAHNDFLTVLLEQGIIGVSFYTIFVIRLFKNTIHQFLQKGFGVTSLFSISVIVLFMGMFSNLIPLATYFAFLSFAYGVILSENKRITFIGNN